LALTESQIASLRYSAKLLATSFAASSLMNCNALLQQPGATTR